MTFGFQSAINIATETIDCIHTTAASHNRVFIVEVMGHKVGWLTLYAGVAGGADIILLPEIPYDIDKVVDAIHKRTKDGKGFTILAVAEGAISKDDAQLTKKQYKAKVASRRYPSVSYEIADQIQEKCGVESPRCGSGPHTAWRQSVSIRQSIMYPSWICRCPSNYGWKIWLHDRHDQQQDQMCAAWRGGRQVKDG